MAKTPKSVSAAQSDNPFRGGGGGSPAPVMTPDMAYRTIGSSGLRAYGGWVREEFLPQLVGRQAARVYREMTDNDATIGSMLFALNQSMRQIQWRVEPASDTPEAAAVAEFYESLMDDMSHTWSQFIDEAQSKLSYGYAPFEIVYKRRLGRQPGKRPNGRPLLASKFDDGKIGIAKLPLRGQDTVLKWFFDPDGELQGMTQQPWTAPIVDIPIEKLLLLRPKAPKNNPEGRSILRNSYRAWYFLKRLEEQEAIMLERMSGLPVLSVPSELLEAASGENPDPNAVAAIAQWQKIITGVKVDEQMGMIIPSNTYLDANRAPSSVPQYKLELLTPQNGGRSTNTFDTSINRYKLDIMTTSLADFLQLGHSSRGTQSLAETKVDLFYQAQHGWAQSDADALNNDLVPRVGDLNGIDPDLLPRFEPDMPQRIDLDGLSNYVLRMAQAGGITFGDPATEEYLRTAAELPELDTETLLDDPNADGDADTNDDASVQKRLAGMIGRRLIRNGLYSTRATTKRRKH